MRYRLSRLIPVRFRSTYGVTELKARRLAADSRPEGLREDETAFAMNGRQSVRLATDGSIAQVRSTWWQFRGRIMRHRVLLVAALTIALVAFMAVPAGAFAQAASTPSPGFFSGLDVATTAVVLGLFAVPQVVALLVKDTASPFAKGATGVVVAAAGATVAILIGAHAPSTITLGFVVDTFKDALVAAVASHVGFWRPAGITGTDGVLTKATPGIIGPVG